MQNQVTTYTSNLTPYKFYFAFENSICQDYITEKFFNIFATNTGPIPIALGGTKQLEYEK